MRCVALLLAAAACAACAQTPVDQGWLASPPATEFRARVVQLALIYGDSSGIDPRGFRITTRATSPPQAGCADVDVAIFQGDEVVRRETVHACLDH